MKTNKLYHIKSTGFKIPNGYFDSLDKNIFSKLESEDVINNPKEKAFKTPKGYFDTLEDTIYPKSFK